jgi:mono/diheme cytochrome c family protein
MRRVAAVLLALAAVPAFAADVKKLPAEQVEYFEKTIRPLLVENCVRCHGPKKQQGGLRLDTAEGLAKGTDSGPAVVPGDPAKSKLIQSVKRTNDYAMPPDKALSKEQVAALEAWVKVGAPFPASGNATVDPAADKKHWAFQPITAPKVPGGSANPIDAFINAKFAAGKLAPAPPADKRTLARRVYFDLIGLPPTAAQLDAFEKDTRPDAYEKLVDELLANPHYGERWGRHWLDVARYADSKGYVFTEDRNYPYAYTYRDYVIRSFNEDKPFNQFVIEQLAADKLTLGDDKRPLAAMGFLTVGRRFSNNIHDITDDRIDVVTRGLMGITVTCARCHDHKFDPIPTADYYALYGVFASSNEPKELPLIGAVERTKEYEQYAAAQQKLDDAVAAERERVIRLRKTVNGAAVGGLPGATTTPDRLLNRADRDKVKRLQKQSDEFRGKSEFAPPRAMVMNDNPQPAQAVVFVRGNPGNRGARVPRQMPEVTGPRTPFTDGSGRLELAKAIASPSNPLTARVFVNRVWLHHFGQGLVRTPSDFGVRSDPPTHPELLDFLASQFMADGWSVKALHRRILLSGTYKRSSVIPAEAAADPENLLLSHQNRKRLEFEPLRDSLLAVSGELDPAVYGRSVQLFNAPYPTRRAVYGYIDRQNLPGPFRTFDLASPEQHTPQRFQTTVPQQALFLMNNPFAVDRTKAVAKRDEVAKATSAEAKVKALYRLILSRNPTTEEAALAVAFVTDAEKVKPTVGQLGAWEQLAQVLLLSNEFSFVD